MLCRDASRGHAGVAVTEVHSIHTAWFCWVAVGLVVAVLIIRSVAGKKSGKKQDNNYSMEEMK